MKLEGIAAVVTGASRGLGAAIAEAFVAEGASLLICARDGEALETVRRRLSSSLLPGQSVHTRLCDMARTDEVDALVEEALARFPDLEVLVNNAGIYGPFGAIEEADWADWVQAISINLMGAVYPCRKLVPHFRKRGRGKIITISGGGATSPLPGLSAYAASKAALVRFCETLHEEVKESGIEVNALAPGLLATRLLDQAIAAGPEKVGAGFHERMVKARAEGRTTPLAVPAAAAVWLASAASDGISGKLISAAWDPWERLAEHRAELAGTDIYTLRRVVPEDRGKNWGER